MPHYDESFIFDDNQNQRKNKRSYQVYKNGLNPRSLIEKTEVLHDLEERGKTALKRNIRNIKQRGNRNKPDSQNGSQILYVTKYKTPDIIVDHCHQISVFDPNKYYDFRNNNLLPLTPCKSLDNLTQKKGKEKETLRNKMRNGVSLQNLLDEGTLKYYVSPLEDHSYAGRDEAKHSYSVAEARCRPIHRRGSQGTPTPGVGVYRQISNEGVYKKTATGMKITILILISMRFLSVFKFYQTYGWPSTSWTSVLILTPQNINTYLT